MLWGDEQAITDSLRVTLRSGWENLLETTGKSTGKYRKIISINHYIYISFISHLYPINIPLLDDTTG
jgi:hypothetical protein